MQHKELVCFFAAEKPVGFRIQLSQHALNIDSKCYIFYSVFPLVQAIIIVVWCGSYLNIRIKTHCFMHNLFLAIEYTLGLCFRQSTHSPLSVIVSTWIEMISPAAKQS